MISSRSISVDLFDLGVLEPRLSGVFCPNIAEEAVGLTAQFTENAETYANLYASSDYFSWLITRAVDLAALDIAPQSILDMGAGAGANSTFPSARIWPEALITATDLSPQLLAILKREATLRGFSDRIDIICVDAMKNIFHPETFDMVIGSAILHHLIDPVLALKSVHRVLRPGGVAIFFEPFETGYSIVAGIFDRIRTESSLRDDKISRSVHDFFCTFIDDVKRRLGRDKSSPIYQTIDDKWLFSKSYFNEVSDIVGFSKVAIDPIQDVTNHLTNQIATYLRIGANTTIMELPVWAQKYCFEADSMFVESAPEIISEAIVVMIK